MVAWGLHKPFWLTFIWTIDNLQVNLRICIDYSSVHKHRNWQLPMMTPAQPPPPAVHVNWSRPTLDRACWAVTLLLRLTHQLFERMRVVRFDLCCRLGLANAAHTAVWTAQLTDVVSAWIALKIAPKAQTTPRFAIEPIWGEVAFHCNFTSIIQLRLSDIILAMISSLISSSRGGVWHGKLQRQYT